MLRARVVVLEALLVGSEAKTACVGKVLRLVKVARLIKDRWRDVLRVLLERWEAI